MSRISVSSSILIDAPVDITWDCLNDPATFVEGIDWVYDAWLETPGALGKGSVYVERARPGPRTGEYRWTISEFDPPHRAVHSHVGREMEADLEARFESVDDARTRYTQDFAFSALPGFRPLGFILERAVMRRKMQTDMDRNILPSYKRIVERRAAASAD